MAPKTGKSPSRKTSKAQSERPVLKGVGYAMLLLAVILVVALPVGAATVAVMLLRPEELGPLSWANWRTIAGIAGAGLAGFVLFYPSTWLADRIIRKNIVLITLLSWLFTTAICLIIFSGLHFLGGFLPEADLLVEFGTIALMTAVLAVAALVHYAITVGIDEVTGVW